MFPNHDMQAERLCKHMRVPKMSVTYLSPLRSPKTVGSICGAYLLLNPSTVSNLTSVHDESFLIPLAL